MQRGKVRHPVLVYVLNMLTCGIYGIYWFFVTCEDINRGLGRKEHNPIVDFVLAIVTCGLWWIWWSWKASESIVELQEKWGVTPKMDAAILFICSFFGFGQIVKQLSMNHAWENGTPGGGPMGHIGYQQPPSSTVQHNQRQTDGQVSQDHHW